MSASAIAFQDELSRARTLAAERKRLLAEAPEMSVDDIMAGFKRELLCVVVPGFGKIYHYPLSIADYVEFQEKVAEDGTTTASSMVQAIIRFALKSDGSQKFSKSDADWLMDAPPTAVSRLASALVQSHRFTLASAEKK